MSRSTAFSRTSWHIRFHLAFSPAITPLERQIPRADLDEWFDFLRPVIANLAVPGEAPGGPDLHEDVEEEKSGSEREGQDSCEGEGEGGCRMTMNLNDNDNGDLIKT